MRSSAHQRKRFSRGREAEDLVEESLAKPRNIAGGKLWRRHAGMRAGRYVAPQGPDFSGILTSRVASLAVHCEVEVKACTDRFDFSRLRESELEGLQTTHELGGASFVLCLFGEPLSSASWYLLPWGFVLREIDRGKAHVAQRELADFLVSSESWLVEAEKIFYSGKWGAS